MLRAHVTSDVRSLQEFNFTQNMAKVDTNAKRELVSSYPSGLVIGRVGSLIYVSLSHIKDMLRVKAISGGPALSLSGHHT